MANNGGIEISVNLKDGEVAVEQTVEDAAKLASIDAISVKAVQKTTNKREHPSLGVGTFPEPSIPRKRQKSEKNERKWLEMFAALKVYKEQHNNCLVPNYYPVNEKLGVWVKTQRYQYRLLNDGKTAKISEERVNLLNSVGFVWDVNKMIDAEHKREWDRNLEQLKLYKIEHGNCNVPSKYAPIPHLGSWMARQRAHYRLIKSGLQSSMTPLQAKKFEYVVYDIGDGVGLDDSSSAAMSGTAAISSSNNIKNTSQSTEPAAIDATACVAMKASTAECAKIAAEAAATVENAGVLLPNPLDAEAARLLEESVATAATAASLLEFADTTGVASHQEMGDNDKEDTTSIAAANVADDSTIEVDKVEDHTCNVDDDDGVSEPPVLDAAQVTIGLDHGSSTDGNNKADSVIHEDDDDKKKKVPLPVARRREICRLWSSDK
mmetsp:Transcript_14013/g.21506  ORF Transcript_14013/g.21506 Transcript_14013/m.21506 type:complete len:435 (+) Transcript_14013:115-1419(+)